MYLFLLQSTNIEFNKNQPIYICGHGNEYNQTISNYSMKDIAEMLKNNTNLSGNEKIYIMACYSKYRNKDGKDMSDLLKEELKKININVESVCRHTTVIVDFFGKAYVYDFKTNIFALKQERYLKKFHCDKLYLSSENTEKVLKKNLLDYGFLVTKYNYDYICKWGKQYE